MRRRRKQSDHAVHHERWLVSYADFMTLLFALFVVLFASTYHDRQALEKVSVAVRNGFQDLQVFSNNEATQTVNQPASKPNGASDLTANAPRRNGGIDILELQSKLYKALGKEIDRKEVALHITPEGFVISLHELGFFDSGQARLLPGAADKIRRIATVLMQYGLDMRVEGHSDNVPIHNTQFQSNWDLSTSRASAVAMMLLDDAHFDPSRMAIAGYGQYHPSASNDTAEGRRANRRVDIVIVATDKTSKAN